MTTVQDLVEWASTFLPTDRVYIDEGGLTLMIDEGRPENEEHYYEIGGYPHEEAEE